MSKAFIWVEKYRPKTVRDIILPEKSKRIMNSFLKQNDIPHLLFHTLKPGSGKTSLSKAIVNDLGADSIFINGSKDGTMDEMRNKVDKFASVVSPFMTSSKKIVIIDEADYISSKFASSMRGVLETFHKTCSFIFTCNHIEKIIEPIRSRCQILDFNFYTKNEIYQAKIKIYKRIEKILKEENIEYEGEVLIALINKKFPDIRSIINLLQYEAQNEGKINSSVIDRINNIDISNLFKMMKERNLKDIREYLHNSTIYNENIYKQLYDNIDKYIVNKKIPAAILLINDYEDKSLRGTNPLITLICLCIELIGNCEFK